MILYQHVNDPFQPRIQRSEAVDNIYESRFDINIRSCRGFEYDIDNGFVPVLVRYMTIIRTTVFSRNSMHRDALPRTPQPALSRKSRSIPAPFPCPGNGGARVRPDRAAAIHVPATAAGVCMGPREPHSPPCRTTTSLSGDATCSPGRGGTGGAWSRSSGASGS